MYRLNGEPDWPSARIFSTDGSFILRGLQSFRGHTGNHPAAVATINAEIIVGRQHNAIGERFCHAHEARIGETHGNVGVLLHKLQDWLQILSDLESDEQDTAPKQSAETGRASCSEKVERLG